MVGYRAFLLFFTISEGIFLGTNKLRSLDVLQERARTADGSADLRAALKGVDLATVLEIIGPPPSASVEKCQLFHLSDDQMKEIRALFSGSVIEDAPALVRAVKRMFTVRLNAYGGDDVCSINLPEDTVERLVSRCPIDTPIEEFLTEKINDWAEMFVNGGL